MLTRWWRWWFGKPDCGFWRVKLCPKARREWVPDDGPFNGGIPVPHYRLVHGCTPRKEPKHG